ncbi:MAG: NUDIX hydrolase [Syntrophomonadaceae bacterium]|nr:NUDIX hydrolase [Syntrophomonadaceae bacterium]
MDFTEETISSREIFKGKIIKLRVDNVRLPDSRESTREIVEHAGAVAIIALDEVENIIMVRQYRKPVEQVLLEIPAGTLEADEEPLACAQRELREETGLTADHWHKVLSYYSAPGFCNEQLHIYLASGLHEGQGETDEDEFVEMVRLPLTEAYQMIFSGEIKDGKSIIGLQYAFNNGNELK